MVVIVASISLIVLLIIFFNKPYRLKLAKYLFRLLNITEAKIAGLSATSLSLETITLTYLSNVRHFSADKPTLILLHGFSGNKYIWNRFAKRFSAHYQLLIPDLKGHGDTPYDPNDNYSVPSQCELLVELIAKLKIQQFSIVGNSMGGMMAAKLVDEMPKRINKIVLIDPAGARSPYAEQMISNNFNPFRLGSEREFYKFYQLVMAKPPYVPKFILQALAHEYMDKREQYTHMFKDFYSLSDFYSSDYRFAYPNAMLIWGLNDKLLPIEDYQQWKNMLNVNTQIYEDLGHMPMVEDVKRVSNDILTFLQKP